MEVVRRPVYAARRALAAAERIAGEEGQGLTEYAFVLSFVALAAVGSVTTFGTAVGTLYATIVSAVPGV